MIQRIVALSGYLFSSLVFSLAGLLYVLFGLAFYIIFFDPRQRTPEVNYFILVIGLFGVILSFLTTLSIAGRANKAVNFPFLVRLPSRPEYLTAIVLAAIVYSTIIEIIMALAAVVLNGPQLEMSMVIAMPPIWLAGNLLMVVLALHATDLVADGWSRVYVFGVLGLLLYVQSGLNLVGEWVSGALNTLGNMLLNQGLEPLANLAHGLSDWLATTGSDLVEDLLGLIFWPFRAIIDGLAKGNFGLAQAMAPAAILLYAVFLFLLASWYFSSKDIFFSE